MILLLKPTPYLFLKEDFTALYKTTPYEFARRADRRIKHKNRK